MELENVHYIEIVPNAECKTVQEAEYCIYQYINRDWSQYDFTTRKEIENINQNSKKLTIFLDNVHVRETRALNRAQWISNHAK